MKKSWKVFLPMFFFALLALACGQKTGASGIEVEEFWTSQDLADTGKRIQGLGGIQLSYQITLQLKPPFYNGPMPLKYISVGKNLGGGMMGSLGSVIMFHDFGEWYNIFIYHDQDSMIYGLPDGAVAAVVVNDKRYFTAECKVTKRINRDNQLAGFELEEHHYNKKGEAIFYSRFEVDFSDGFKTKELETRGKKKKEYFFLWPTGLSAGM